MQDVTLSHIFRWIIVFLMVGYIFSEILIMIMTLLGWINWI